MSKRVKNTTVPKGWGYLQSPTLQTKQQRKA